MEGVSKANREVWGHEWEASFDGGLEWLRSYKSLTHLTVTKAPDLMPPMFEVLDKPDFVIKSITLTIPEASKKIYRLLSHQMSQESLRIHLMCPFQDQKIHRVYLDTLNCYPKLHSFDVSEPFTLAEVKETCGMVKDLECLTLHREHINDSFIAPLAKLQQVSHLREHQGFRNRTPALSARCQTVPNQITSGVTNRNVGDPIVNSRKDTVSHKHETKISNIVRSHCGGIVKIEHLRPFNPWHPYMGNIWF